MEINKIYLIAAGSKEALYI